MSPFIANKRVSISNSHFRNFFTTCVFSSINKPAQMHKSTFEHFQNTPIFMSSVLYTRTEWSHKSSAGDGGVLSFDDPYLEINQCLFRSNKANGNGGAIFVDHKIGKFVIYDSFFLHNTALKSGGAVFCISRKTVIEDTLFDTNSAPTGSHIRMTGMRNITMERNNFLYGVGDESVTLDLEQGLILRDLSFYSNEGPLSISYQSEFANDMQVKHCCFSEGGGDALVKLQAERDDTFFRFTDCCFNDTALSVVTKVQVIFDKSCTFGDCGVCNVPLDTPAPTATMHSTIDSASVIIAICGVAVTLIIGVVGVIVTGRNCRNNGERESTTHPLMRDEI